MWTSTSASPSTLFLLSRSLLQRRNSPNCYPNRSLNGSLQLRVSASMTAEAAEVDVSWLSPPNDELNGWTVPENGGIEKKRGSPKYVLVGIGASVALALAAIGFLSVAPKGVRLELHKPMHTLHVIVTSSRNGKADDKSVEADASGTEVNNAEDKTEGIADGTTDKMEAGNEEKVPRVLKTVSMDSTQEKALSVLSKLNILESGVKGDKLCSRREFARWLIKENTMLERNPKHRTIPSISLSGSVTVAFDDITPKDPDFRPIQALAEAGILPSKLSADILSTDPENSHNQGIYFYPERPITRHDMISWKAHLDYDSLGVIEETPRPAVSFMDMRVTSLDVSPALCLDMLAGDKSIIRKVFGKTRRFEPKKPVTIAQAAVALTSGRMAQAIKVELQRLEADKYSRETEMEEIRSELLDRGDIQSCWHPKLREEFARGRNLENYYLDICEELEREKMAQEKFLADQLNERAALDWQRQLIKTLREEISEMSERLETERDSCEIEQRRVQEMRTELEAILDAKSILEAELEAGRMLRTWVEEEARKHQARAKVLEEVGRRWNWTDQN